MPGDGFVPGGGTDVMARIVAPRLSERLGQPVIIENRPGAGGNLATEVVAKAAPDGYTLLMGTIAALAINPSLFKNLPFDPVKDLTTISMGVSLANVVVVNASLAAKTLPELIALAQQQPGKISYSSSGNGTAGHLSGALFESMANVSLLHVPYKSGGQAMTDLFGDEEITIIGPALERLNAAGIACEGPVPSDTVFVKALAGRYDGVVMMYHDQGQIATKLIGFSKGITVTSGLPQVLTTPAHGTTFDIVGQRKANVGGIEHAFRAAARIALLPPAAG